MDSVIEFLSLILISGGAQGVFMSIILLTNSQINTLANRILAHHIFLFSIFIIFPEIIDRYYLVVPHLIASYFPTTLLLGPSLLFYVQIIIGDTMSPQKKDSWHLLPFLANILYLIPFYLQPSAFKVQMYETVITQGVPLDFILMWGITGVHILVYIFLAIRLFAHHSLNRVVHAEWLRKLLIGNSVVWGIYIFVFVAYQFGLSNSVFAFLQKIFSLSMCAFVYTIGYIAIKSPRAFTKTSKAKYEKSGLSEDRAEMIFGKLTRYMETEQPYKDPLISIKKIAAHLSVSSNHISQIINQKLSQNFHAFINTYRIDHSKKLLEQVGEKKMTILEIAYAVGFNSASTYNAAFKKHTGMTPSKFRKKMEYL